MLLRGSIGFTILVSGAFMVADLAHAQERTGEQIVKSQCFKCHEAGANGAPRIDDRAAWAPRMTKGLDATVRSAIRGHGKMPARGGLADITDNELRSAVLYMFYPAGATAKPAAAAPARPAQDAHRKVIGGIEFDLGITLAETAPVAEPKPSGKGYYYVNVSLHDAATHAEITGAQVEARAANAMGGDSKKLKAATINNATSYGEFFRMQGTEPYAITVQVRPSNSAQPVVAKFEFKP
jgi:cytochrome c5